jgi:polysaccharide deacetylase 2 family uncharacterized protein YibQ
MADDDLSAPLGQRKKKKKRFVLPIAMPKLIAGALALCVLVVAGWALFVDDPFGGEPMVIVSAQARNAPPATNAGNDSAPTAQTKPSALAAPAALADTDKPAAPGARTVTIIDGTTGKRQDVQVAPPSDNAAAAKPGIDQRLLETSPHGMIPKIAPDGARPADVYARPVKPQAGRADGPRVAIVIGGLGIGANGTSEALAKLPAPVTLAFAPYGTDLERLVARARGEGHEVLLQVGMEPFDYPDNDPGPQTLLTSATAEQNIDRLQWFMSRFQGYVGVSALMGARFTATDQAFAPVLREVVKRGLIYFDDGTSPRSVASQMSGANNAAFAKADIALDAVPSPGEIDAALARLEAMARSRGVAVGAASALPVSIDRVARWAKAAEARGITLVPLSTVANKPKSS